MFIRTRHRRENVSGGSRSDLADRYVSRVHVTHASQCPLSVGKDRREKGDFIGAAHVLRHLKEGPPKRRVGLIVEGAPARGASCRFAILKYN